MIITGVDCGVRKVAIATIEVLDGAPGEHRAAAFESKSKNRQEQLLEVAEWTRTLTHVHGSELIYVEEPLVGRGVRTSLQIAQTVGAVLSRASAHAYLVDNNSWKKTVCSKGGLAKSDVALWLKEQHPCYSANCDGVAGHRQDAVDATCIALYGVQQLSVRALLRSVHEPADAPDVAGLA